MNKKTPNKPKVLKYMSIIISFLESVSPRLAGKFTLRLFLKPFRFETPKREFEAVEQANIFKIKVDENQVAIYEWGEGPVVWVIHGWSGRATQLYEIVKELVKAGFKVYGIDAPGHGKSSGDESNVVLFENTLQELNRLKGPPEAFIGHSLGGAVGFFALANGIKMKKLVSISAPTIADDIIKEMLSRIGGGEISFENLKKEFVKRFNEPFEKYTALNWAVPEPKIPVLVIHDEDDKDAPIHHANELTKLLPKAEFYLTKGLGHNRILRDKEVINKVVSFIKKKV